MATVTKDNVAKLPSAFAAPYGNKVSLHFNLTANASGALAASDQATALVNGDIVRLGVLPAGMMLIDCLGIISDAFDASVNFDVGFAYVDGEDDDDVAQDADYFWDAQDAHAVAIARKTNTTAPVTLPKDAYLILTIDTDDNEAAGVLDFFVEGILNGPA